jgi:voltage-gated potassium channel
MKNMQKFKNIVNKQDTFLGKAFDVFFQVLIIIGLIIHSLETVPEFKVYQNIFDLVEVCLICLFSLEYLVRLLAADKKLSFVFSFYGFIDLLAIVPFFFGKDLKFLRIVRLARVLKLFRYSDAMNRYVVAIKSIKNELIVFGTLIVIMLYIASAGIYHFENEAQPEVFKSIFHSMWWAVATLTTVGYGDIYPVTMGGKVFTFFILMLGLGVVAIPPALMASALMKKDEDK